jgi:hypothetical protein
LKTTGALITLGLALALTPWPAAAQPSPTAYSVQSDSTTDHLFSIDLKTGAAKDLGPTGFGDIESMAFGPDCATLYGVDDVKDVLVTCDTANGACKEVGRLGVDVTDTGLAFTVDGGLFMSTDAPKNPFNFYRLDPETGAATLVGNQGQEVTGLAANRSGLYGLGGDGKNNLVMIDPETGVATPVGPLGTVSTPDGGFDFDARGVLYGITDGSSKPGAASQIFTVNPATGVATVGATVTLNGHPINGFEGLAIAGGVCSTMGPKAEAIDVPAAADWALLLLAVTLATTGILVLRRS